MPNTYSITGANEAVCISLKAAGDTLLPNELPQAEYMYGCVPTAIGMLLGYYDLYGYTVGSKTYDFSNLIPGTISVKSRGNGDGDIYDMSDSSVLAKFIASPEYVSRFVGKTPAQEKPYTFVGGDPDKGLNTSIWNCLADYLGAGQYWRGSGDYLTQYYSQSLSWLLTTSQTKTTDGIAIPSKYYDYKYGLSLYVESVGYELDPDQTRTYKLENNVFTFSTLKSEIDAGRPVLFSLKDDSGSGHMVIAYGYNASTEEIIFDDTYRAGCRMTWDGTYKYSGNDYSLSAATIVVFTVNAPPVEPDILTGSVLLAPTASATRHTNTIPNNSNLYLSAQIKNTGGSTTGKGFYVKINVDGNTIKNIWVPTLAAGSSYSLKDINLGTFSAGDHTWTVQVDGSGSITESDEDNNITSGRFYVRTANGYRNIKSDVTIPFGVTSSSLRVPSGGIIRNYGNIDNMQLISSGQAHVYHGGKVTSGVVMAGGVLQVHSGGRISSTAVIARGEVRLTGGSAYKTGVQSGRISAGAGAVLSSSTLLAGANVRIYHQAVAKDTVLESGAIMHISKGGKHQNMLQIKNGAVVSAYSGSTIEFSVAGRAASNGYLINNLALIKGAPSYTVTVDAAQAAGTYKLAQGASGFGATVSIGSQTVTYGAVSANGDNLIYNGATYSLKEADGDLTLTITGAVSVETERFAAGKFSTAGGLFEFTTDGTGFIHASSGKTQIAGTLNASTWGLLAAGDFNHSGIDGLLWLEKSTGKLYAQNSLSNFNEVTNKTNYLGTAGAGGGIIYAGDFTGTGFDCALINNAVSGSDYYDLTVQGKLSGGSAFTGSLAKLHNAWQTGDTLKGNTSKAADVNAKNYMFDVAAVGDFNGDGADDVLIRNVMPASVNGVNVSGSGDLFTFLTGDMDDVRAGKNPTVTYVGNAPSDLEIEGIGDFNGDGTDDLLLLQDLKVSVWKMKNGQRTGVQDIGYISANQEIAGIADLNNDGTDDVILYNRSTDTYMGWQLKNYYNNSSIVLA